MPAMDKLKYYVLQDDHILQENLPKIEVLYKSIPSNYHTILGDETMYKIVDFTMKFFDTKHLDEYEWERTMILCHKY